MFAEKRIFLAAAILLFAASFAATAIQLRGVSDSTCFMDAFPQYLQICVMPYIPSEYLL